ncbi:MAG: hypothetical protein JO001_23375 [Alphaproteobacteria bacterium]|nr:hypothetical protein [Alphaproteobacteria bacterium]
MIYMVEMDFPHPEREAAWHEWYLAHIRVLLTVPGFRASQRFRAVSPMPAPYLALHEVESAALFDSADYRSRGGPASTGEWRDLHTNWQRNLLDGLDETPEVSPDAHLLLVRDAPEVRLPPEITVSPLRGVGLDRKIEECRLAVVTGDAAALIDLVERDPRCGLYRPISEKICAAPGSC